MKVFSVIDNQQEQITSPARDKKAARARARNVKKKNAAPPRENLTADQIRAKVAAHTTQISNKNIMTKERLAKFEANKIPDLHDADKVPVGDVGVNDPNDLATHGKLKSVISKGAFNFSEKERAALEQILKD